MSDTTSCSYFRRFVVENYQTLQAVYLDLVKRSFYVNHNISETGFVFFLRQMSVPEYRSRYTNLVTDWTVRGCEYL
jgi:hypothetical protein